MCSRLLLSSEKGPSGRRATGRRRGVTCCSHHMREVSLPLYRGVPHQCRLTLFVVYLDLLHGRRCSYLKQYASCYSIERKWKMLHAC